MYVCVCFFLSHRSALMQHVFRPKHFTVFASPSQWDPPISSSRVAFEGSVCAATFLPVSRVCVCLGASPLFPESSAQLDSECALRPHIMPNFCEGASQSIWSVFVGEKGSVCHRERSPLSKVDSAGGGVQRGLSSQSCDKRRSQSGQCQPTFVM